MSLKDEILSYIPANEQEEADKAELLQWLDLGDVVFTRRNPAHFTVSAWVVNQDRSKVLMVYHNIYKSWSWMGGHADGEQDLFQVAKREVQEESGLACFTAEYPEMISLEILHVPGHEKRGHYVSSHLHLNVTYLLEADEAAPVRMKPDENSGVAWIKVSELPQRVSEDWMLERIYSKLIKKASAV